MASTKKAARPISPVVSLPNSSRRPSQVPTPEPSSSVPTDTDLSALIGAHIQLTIDGKTHTGTLWTYDPVLSCLVLESPSKHANPHSIAGANKKDYQFFNVKATNPAVEVLALPTADSTKALTQVKPVALDKVRANVEQALEAEKQRAKRLGKGVSQLAQLIFDSLSKTLAAEWQGTSILVLEDVLIKEPYAPQDCSSAAAPKAKLERVQKVLEGERARILKLHPDLEEKGG